VLASGWEDRETQLLGIRMVELAVYGLSFAAKLRPAWDFVAHGAVVSGWDLKVPLRNWV
jgi:hypothetical protein